MAYILQGRLCGYLCDDCDEPLEGIVVRAYSPAANDVVGRAAAPPKDTLAAVARNDVEVKASRLLAEATVDAAGAFTLGLPKEGYDGGPFDVDLYCGNVPHMKPRRHAPDPVQLHVTTLQPRWREVEGGSVAAFDYCVPARVWCWVRGLLGAWTICGQVTDCDSNQPVAGVIVRAFDVDWIQDDDLGSATSDATGHYRIDYSTDDFRRTPWSPTINIELVGGPDLYFRVEAPGGAPLLVEPRSMGRTPGRENVGPCACIDLCLSGYVPPGPVATIPMFTQVGSYSIRPADGAFTADGTTTAGGFAFTDDIPLVGIMPDPLSPDAIEYRFTVAELPAGPPIPVDAAHMASTVIGYLEFFAWDPVANAWFPDWTPFFANNPGAVINIPQDVGPPLPVSVNTPVKANGWIEAPRTNVLAPRGPGRFIPSGPLAVLHTTMYTLESFDLNAAAPPLPLNTGDPVPAPQQSAKPTFRITFEARMVAGGAPVGSNTLDTIAFSNMSDTYTRHPYWAGGPVTTTGVAALGIAEMEASGGCAELADHLHAKFTLYHPYLGQPEISFEGNPILPPPLNPPLTGGEAHSGPAGLDIDISLLAKCAYILWLTAPLLLTSGYGQLPMELSDHIAFCKK